MQNVLISLSACFGAHFLQTTRRSLDKMRLLHNVSNTLHDNRQIHQQRL